MEEKNECTSLPQPHPGCLNLHHKVREKEKEKWKVNQNPHTTTTILMPFPLLSSHLSIIISSVFYPTSNPSRSPLLMCMIEHQYYKEPQLPPLYLIKYQNRKTTLGFLF